MKKTVDEFTFAMSNAVGAHMDAERYIEQRKVKKAIKAICISNLSLGMALGIYTALKIEDRENPALNDMLGTYLLRSREIQDTINDLLGG